MSSVVSAMNEADNTDPSERFLCLHEIVEAAEQALSAHIWNYLRGASETETTMQRNRQALDSVAFRPRVLNDMREVAVGGCLLGRDLPCQCCLRRLAHWKASRLEEARRRCGRRRPLAMRLC